MKDNDEAIRLFGLIEATKMCKKLLASDDVPGIHIYTLNREVFVAISLTNLLTDDDIAVFVIYELLYTRTHASDHRHFI